MSSIWTLSDPNGTKFLIWLSVPDGLIQIHRQITGYLMGLMFISVKIIIIIKKTHVPSFFRLYMGAKQC